MRTPRELDIKGHTFREELMEAGSTSHACNGCAGDKFGGAVFCNDILDELDKRGEPSCTHGCIWRQVDPLLEDLKRVEEMSDEDI